MEHHSPAKRRNERERKGKLEVSERVQLSSSNLTSNSPHLSTSKARLRTRHRTQPSLQLFQHLVEPSLLWHSNEARSISRCDSMKSPLDVGLELSDEDDVSRDHLGSRVLSWDESRVGDVFVVEEGGVLNEGKRRGGRSATFSFLRFDEKGRRATHRNVDELIGDHRWSTKVEAELPIELPNANGTGSASISTKREETSTRRNSNSPCTPSRTTFSSCRPREG